MKKTIIQALIAILIFGVIITSVFLLMNKSSEENKNAIEDLETNSTIVSTDPARTAAKFIEANGTMGNIEKDITQETMGTNEATYSNGTRRLKALEKIEEALIPGNLLIIGNERDNIRNFVRDLDYPFLYETRNIVVGEPSEPEKLTVYSVNGPTEYDSVKVKVNFDSARIFYSCAKDVTYDGIHREFTNIESFQDIEVILVKSGDLWFVYDVTDSEKIVNERFASWSGTSPSTIDYSKNTETGMFRLENFTPSIQPEFEETEVEEKQIEEINLESLEVDLENEGSIELENQDKVEDLLESEEMEEVIVNE